MKGEPARQESIVSRLLESEIYTALSILSEVPLVISQRGVKEGYRLFFSKRNKDESYTKKFNLNIHIDFETLSRLFFYEKNA